MVNGAAPDKGASAYAELKQLVSLRNELVHFKSKSFSLNEIGKAADFHDQLRDRLRAGVDTAIRAVVSALTELGRLHGNSDVFMSSMRWTEGSS